MPRPKKYASVAERQRAHRARVKERLAQLQPLPIPTKKPRKLTRPARLERVAEELRALADEYQDWLDAQPANLASAELTERLEETIGQLQTALETLEMIDPPRGFGR